MNKYIRQQILQDFVYPNSNLSQYDTELIHEIKDNTPIGTIPTIDVDFFTTDGTGIGTYVSSLTSLMPGTTYYYRAYATNSQGTVYGLTYDFITVDLPTPEPTSTPTPTTTPTPEPTATPTPTPEPRIPVEYYGYGASEQDAWDNGVATEFFPNYIYQDGGTLVYYLNPTGEELPASGYYMTVVGYDRDSSRYLSI